MHRYLPERYGKVAPESPSFTAGRSGAPLRATQNCAKHGAHRFTPCGRESRELVISRYPGPVGHRRRDWAEELREGSG
jgi:hypothetical protein